MKQVLLYQSAAFVFLDGSQVSEGLVIVSLAFHLFVIGTVIFALCSYDCSRLLLCCRDCYTVVICFVVFCCFSHLILAGKQPFGVLRWFQLFCFFHLVSAVCVPD